MLTDLVLVNIKDSYKSIDLNQTSINRLEIIYFIKWLYEMLNLF